MEGEKIALPVSVLVLRADVEPLVCSGGGSAAPDAGRAALPCPVPRQPVGLGVALEAGPALLPVQGAASLLAFSLCVQHQPRGNAVSRVRHRRLCSALHRQLAPSGSSDPSCSAVAVANGVVIRRVSLIHHGTRRCRSCQGFFAMNLPGGSRWVTAVAGPRVTGHIGNTSRAVPGAGTARGCAGDLSVPAPCCAAGVCLSCLHLGDFPLPRLQKWVFFSPTFRF